MADELFFIAAFLAEVIGTMAGFGSSTVFLPLALLFLDFRVALVLVAFFHIFGNISRLSFFRHGLDLRMLAVFGVPSVIFTLAGALLVPHIDQNAMKLIVGIFLLLYSTLSLWKPDLKASPETRTAVAGGCLSGFLAGLIGTGGAVRGAFLTAFSLEKSRYLATAAAIALAVDFTRLPVYLASGFLPGEYLLHIPVLLVVALAGSFTGKKIVEKIPQKTFRKIVLAAISLVSLKFIFDGASALVLA